MKLLKTYKKYSVKLLNMTKINNGIYILKTRLYIIGKGTGHDDMTSQQRRKKNEKKSSTGIGMYTCNDDGSRKSDSMRRKI